MNKRLILLVSFAFSVCLTGIVQADTIVDTGQGPSIIGGYQLDSSYWFAGKFSIIQAYTITDVSGWMFAPANFRGPVTAVIYGNGGQIPDTNQQYFSANFTPDIGNGWRGLSGLSWGLNPGTYWVAFEVRGASPFQGEMLFPCASPLSDSAVRLPAQGYIEADYLNLGIRILGDPIGLPMPEPSTIALLTAGLGVLALAVRRKRV